MPVIQRKAALSSQGFGQFLGSVTTGLNYIENYFNSSVYGGTGNNQLIFNNIPLANTAEWKTFSFVKNNYSLNKIRTDSSGNIYTVGYTNYSYTKYHAYLIKFNSSGTILWQREIYQTTFADDCLIQDLAVDSSGNVIVAGYSSYLSGNFSFIIKFDSSGVLQWQRQLLDSTGIAYSVTTDTANNIYFTGTDYHTGVNQYAYIAKYNSSGTLVWQRTLSDVSVGGYAAAQSVKTDSSNNVYITGYGYNGSTYYAFIAKYNTGGTIQWQRKYTSSGSFPYSIVLDSSANVYVCGTFFILKYNTSGVLQWQRDITNVTYYDITVDASNNVYAVGNYVVNNVVYGFIAKYNSSGALQWQRAKSLTGSLGLNGVATYTDGTVYSCGYVITNQFEGIVTKLLQDGTTTGGVAYISMSAAAQTDSAGTGTDAAGTMTDAAGVGTSSTPSFTSITSAITPTIYVQSAITSANGLVWIKSQTSAYNHNLFDTVSGATKLLHTNNTTGTATDTSSLTSFNANGFILGSGNTAGSQVNTTSDNFVSWTFAKKAKFFDIVSYTGTGVARTISHNLQSVPGLIIVKRTDTTGNWQVYHSGLTSAAYAVQLNLTNAQASDTTIWNSTTPTGTVFSVGTNVDVNASGGTYVAYLFASNSGGFGTNNAENVITCGTYTGNGSNSGPSVNLGFEPQWLMVKNVTGAANWVMEDTLRGMAQNNSNYLISNSLNAETALNPSITPTSSGFKVVTNNALVNTSASTYIYVAIRRGPMQTPINSGLVFASSTRYGTGAVGSATAAGFVTDFAMTKTFNDSTQNWAWTDRLRGPTYELSSDNQTAENYSPNDVTSFTSMGGFNFGTSPTGNVNTSGVGYVDYYFKRAPGFFDEICFSGTGAIQTVNHNLGVQPNLMIFKTRNVSSDWPAFFNFTGTTYDYASVQNAGSATTKTYGSGPGANYLNALPNASSVTFGFNASWNASGENYVGYLFANLAGSVKIGTYTGTGSTQTIDCGFSKGAQWVMVKRIDAGTQNWLIWDLSRGMEAGNDNYLTWDALGVQVNANNVYSSSPGFQVVGTGTNVNGSGNTYLYMAIA